MWKRNPFRRPGARPVALSMLVVLVVAVAGLLVARHQPPAWGDDRLSGLLGALGRAGQKVLPATSSPDLQELLQLYRMARALHPDSLSRRDSATLTEINQRLNQVIHEKN